MKRADLQHDQDRSRLPVITAEDEARFAKYAEAERLLLEDQAEGVQEQGRRRWRLPPPTAPVTMSV